MRRFQSDRFPTIRRKSTFPRFLLSALTLVYHTFSSRAVYAINRINFFFRTLRSIYGISFLAFFNFRLGYLAMEFINCTMRSCSCSSSSKRRTCIKTFSVKPSDFAKSAGDTFKCFISENTISFAMTTPPSYVPEQFYWENILSP